MTDVSVSTVIAPGAVEPIIGYREWVVVGHDVLSPLARTAWDDEPMEAQCIESCHRAAGLWRRARHHEGPAPDPDCVCGIYALFDPSLPNRRHRLSRAAGAVVMWGRIEVHEAGMRAQFARIVALTLPGGRHRGADRMVARLAYEIGVPAVPVDDLEAAARVHGQPIPPVLIPG